MELDLNLPIPKSTVCFVCGKCAPPDGTLKRCKKCLTVPYCGTDCQTEDWPNHKLIWAYSAQGCLTSTRTNVVDSSPRFQKGCRTKADIMIDMNVWTNAHFNNTLTYAAWQVLGLLRNLSRSETHFFAITVRRNRNFAAVTPRTIYDFVGAKALPLALLENKFGEEGPQGAIAHPVHDVLEPDRARRLRDGALGSVLFMVLELDARENKTVEEAFRTKSVCVVRPLGLYKEHERKLRSLPRMAHKEKTWKRCIENALKGGIYYYVFHPFRG